MSHNQRFFNGKLAYFIYFFHTKQRMTDNEKPVLYKELLFTADEVDARIMEMAIEIVKKYNPKDTIFVSLLNGAQPFATKLMFAIQLQNPYFHPNVQSMIVSRYGPNREPGPLKLVTDLPPTYRNLAGYSIVLLDDLIDVGDTLDYAKAHLLEYGAVQVESVVLVKKHKAPQLDGGIAMFGFEAPDVWLTGMGMDDERLGAEGNRWAGWIAIANE
jgi:hypoxanthine phosphoribosyltransferase